MISVDICPYTIYRKVRCSVLTEETCSKEPLAGLIIRTEGGVHYLRLVSFKNSEESIYILQY